MDIRSISLESSLDEIINLLLTSLPAAAEKQVLTWKHLENPFGKSFCMGAYQDNQLIGIRIFMNWQFKFNNNIENWCRPVDTATHPDFRGKGIFSKLTLEGINALFPDKKFKIFNTPNKNSLPGYLKMGWQKVQAGCNYYYSIPGPGFMRVVMSDNLELSLSDFPEHSYNQDVLETHKTYDFISWRYLDGRYQFARPEDKPNALLIYSLAKLGPLKVVQVKDFIGDKRILPSLLNSLCWKLGAPFFYDNVLAGNNKGLFSFSRGESVVAINEREAAKSREIALSAGDLEGLL